MTARYRTLASQILDEFREGSLSSDAFSYWMNRLEYADTNAEIDAVEREFYGAPLRRNGRIPVGTTVTERGRQGVVVAHRPQGMADVRFEGGMGLERRAEKNLRRNPRKNPRKNPGKEQFHAQVQAIYGRLVADALGVRNFVWRGERADERALADGRLTQGDVDKLLSRAFAIATAQGQRTGHLRKGTNAPTAKGKRASARRVRSGDTAQDEFEHTLALRRNGVAGRAAIKLAKKSGAKVAAKGGAKFVPFLGEAMMVIDAAPAVWDEGKKKVQSQGKAARESYQLARKGKYREAARHGARSAWKDISDTPRALARVAGTGVMGKEGYELARQIKGRKKR